MKRWIAQVFEQRTFLGRESFEQKLLERWREDETEKLLKEMKENIERWLKDMIKINENNYNVSCQGHIFIVSWWLKSKLVTLGNSFKN